MHVTAVDVAAYSGVLSDCYVATDADARRPQVALGDGARRTSTRSRASAATSPRRSASASRYLQPAATACASTRSGTPSTTDFADSPLRPLLLTSLLLAADRVDSTTGLQMAYLKQWAPRSHRDLALEPPDAPRRGRADRASATRRSSSTTCRHVDLAYLDPPYNQHRYFTNYHVWETLVRWDAPEHYGIACKRVDARDAATKSVFNRKAEMPAALRDVVQRVRAEVVVLSYNDEAWIEPDELAGWLRDAGHEEVRILAFDSKRYVGAQIGIHGPTGRAGRHRVAPAQHRAGLRRRPARPGRGRGARPHRGAPSADRVILAGVADLDRHCGAVLLVGRLGRSRRSSTRHRSRGCDRRRCAAAAPGSRGASPSPPSPASRRSRGRPGRSRRTGRTRSTGRRRSSPAGRGRRRPAAARRARRCAAISLTGLGEPLVAAQQVQRLGLLDERVDHAPLPQHPLVVVGAPAAAWVNHSAS